MENYDDWKTDNPPEEKENECGYCGEECEGEFCDENCKRGYISDMNEDE